jgi:L-threonylcarbamoyladenylate synthase
LNKIIRIDADRPDPAVVARAVDVLEGGGLVVIPTRHLYGLAVDALNPSAVARVFTVKQRPSHLPLLIMVAAKEDAARYAQHIDERATMLMDAFWPGKVTIVLVAGEFLPPALTGGTGRIGIRVPGNAACRSIVQALGKPVTATSANLSGKAGCHCIDDLHPNVAAEADLILDAGPLIPGIGSTVVDVHSTGVHVLREGAVTTDAIQSALANMVGPPPA